MLRVRSITTGVVGSPWYTNTYFTGETAQDAVEAVTKMKAFWVACAPLISNTLRTQVQPEVLQIDPATGDIEDLYSAPSAVTAHTNSSEMLPPANQAVIALRTGVIRDNRIVQGRILVPGLGEDRTLAGALSPTAGGFLVDAAENLIGAGDSGGDLAVWSRPKEAPSPFPGPGLEALVTAVTYRSPFGVLRSRRD